MTDFWSRVDQSGGPDACWPWTGGRSGNGYGHVQWNGQQRGAHRIALMLSGTPIQDDQDTCHSCDNRICCNPRHLFAGSRSENMRDMWRKGRGFQPPTMMGSANPMAVFSDEQVAEIRQLYTAGFTAQEIAARMVCSASAAWRAATGVTYRHLPGATRKTWHEARRAA